MKSTKLKEFEETIGYSFHDKNILLLALTHSSYANENKSRRKGDNERLEFLGDAVLELTVSDFLFRLHPDFPEGKLTRLRSALVCEFTLAGVAREIRLGEYLLLSKGEDMTGGRKRDSILSDAVEAVIGAIYLDGGMKESSAFIKRSLLTDIESKTLFYDAKTILQEIVQARGDKELEYRLLEETGPDHDKKFRMEVVIDHRPYKQGIGRTKKAAEQMAAYETLLVLKQQQV